MNLREMALRIKKGEMKGLFSTNEAREEVSQLSADEVESRLHGFTEAPMIRRHNADMQLSKVYHILCWMEVLKQLSIDEHATVIEIAPGAGTHIIRAFDAISNGKGRYVAFNLNRKLTSDFKTQTGGLNLDIRVIEDDAKNALRYIPKESVDIVTGNHAINDILETIIASKEGLDTIEGDYFEVAPTLMRKYENAYLNGTLKNLVFDDFIETIHTTFFTLKAEGHLVLNYYVYPVEINWGGSVRVRSAFVNMARQWVTEAGLGFEAVSLNGFDPKWWGLFRKC